MSEITKATRLLKSHSCFLAEIGDGSPGNKGRSSATTLARCGDTHQDSTLPRFLKKQPDALPDSDNLNIGLVSISDHLHFARKA